MRKYCVAVCGAFNVYSYGDSLFPIAFANEMKKRNINIEMTLFAPQKRGQLYYDDREVYSYDDLETQNSLHKFDLVLIGGGELLHFHKILFTDQSGNEMYYQEAEIWKIPIEFARQNNIECIINAVGAPDDFSSEKVEILKQYLNYVRYIAVRDKYSYKRLKQAGINSFLVPDSLWNVDDYFHGSEFKKKEYIVVQYGTQHQKKQMLTTLQDSYAIKGLKIIFISINYCHEGSYVLRDMENGFTCENIEIISNRLSVMEIYKLISEASLFIGTSLHGVITATASGVPSIIIDMYPEIVGKMDGLVEWFDNSLKIISDVRNLKYVNPEICVKDLQHVRKCVDMHFDKIAECLIGENANE